MKASPLFLSGLFASTLLLNSCTPNTLNQVAQTFRLAMKLQNGEAFRYQQQIDQKLTLPFNIPGVSPTSLAIPGSFTGMDGLQALQNLANPTVINTQLNLNYAFRVQLVNPDGLTTVQMTYQGLTLNGKRDDQSEIFNLTESPLRALEGQSLTFKIDALGAISDVQEADWWKQISVTGLRTQQLGINTQTLLEGVLGPEGQKALLQSIFPRYSNQSLTPGAGWNSTAQVEQVNFGYLPSTWESAWKFVSQAQQNAKIEKKTTITADPEKPLSIGIGPLQMQLDIAGDESTEGEVEMLTGLPISTVNQQNLTLTPRLPEIPDFLKPLVPIPNGTIRMENRVSLKLLDD